MRPLKIVALCSLATSAVQMFYLGPTATHAYKYQQEYSYMPLFANLARSRWLEWVLNLSCLFVASTLQLSLLFVANTLLITPHFELADEVRCVWSGAVGAGLLVFLNATFSYGTLKRALEFLRKRAASGITGDPVQLVAQAESIPQEHPTVWLIVEAFQLAYLVQVLYLRSAYPFTQDTAVDTVMLEYSLVIGFSFALAAVELALMWLVRLISKGDVPQLKIGYRILDVPVNATVAFVDHALVEPLDELVKWTKSPDATPVAFICDLFVALPIVAVFLTSVLVVSSFDMGNVALNSEWKVLLPAIEFAFPSALIVTVIWHRGLSRVAKAIGRSRGATRARRFEELARFAQETQPNG